MTTPLNSILNFLLHLMSRSKLPKVSGEMRLPGVNGKVEILRDKLGLPHIFAENLHDMFFAQGYVHAQDRLWQMEFNQRLVAGRVAEILGKLALPLDKWIRTLTMRRVAEHEVSLLNPETCQYLEAYAGGVNAFIQQGKLPIEFTLLRYKPEPWIIPDTLAWIKMMAWTLSANWESEILRARLVEKLGAKKAAELEPYHLQRWPFIVPPGFDYSLIGTSALEKAALVRPFTGPSPYEGLGSNNWVVSGNKTNTGMPLLANDMHLMLSAPAVWYENHLVAEDFNLYGITFPGIPGIVAGFNGHVAWGFTNGFPDVQDLFMEHLQRTPDGSLEVEYNGHWEKAKVIHETIKIKGEPPIVHEIVITRHGPIINSLAPDLCGEDPLALCWTALEPDTMIQGIFEMLRATDCRQFHQSLRYWTTPVQNTVYADTQGNIGYTFPGKVPIRSKGDGLLPVPGWTGEYEWEGYIPFETLPHLENPPQGFIASANNRTVSPDFPVPMALEPISGDRAQRIVEMLVSAPGGRIDISYIKQMHYDLISPTARVFSSVMRQITLDQHPEMKFLSTRQELNSLLQLFQNWDGQLRADSAAAAVYQSSIRKLASLLLSEKLGELVIRYMGKGPTPVLQEGSLIGERWMSWICEVLSDTNSAWFDLGYGETRDQVLLLALDQSFQELKSLLGANEILAGFFNRGPFSIGGDYNTVWATGSSMFDLSSKQCVGPPYRVIFDLGNPTNSASILAPGQSGNPASPNYDDQIEDWFTSHYHSFTLTREQVETETISRLILNKSIGNSR